MTICTPFRFIGYGGAAAIYETSTRLPFKTIFHKKYGKTVQYRVQLRCNRNSYFVQMQWFTFAHGLLKGAIRVQLGCNCI